MMENHVIYTLLKESVIQNRNNMWQQLEEWVVKNEKIYNR